jgi:hypothetical protein
VAYIPTDAVGPADAQAVAAVALLNAVFGPDTVVPFTVTIE